MILTVDVHCARPAATLAPSGRREAVVVVAAGSFRRDHLDDALRRLGAGCAPGHSAELRIAWLEAALTPAAHGAWPSTLIDRSGEWLAAPVVWADDGVLSERSSASGDSPRRFAHTETLVQASVL